MGTWSEFIYTYTPNVMIDFSKLSKNTLEWLNCKADFNVSFTNETKPMTILELGSKFCDTAKIYGYLDKETVESITGLLDGLTESVNMVFTCDADYIDYYVLNLDKLTKKLSVLIIDNEKLNVNGCELSKEEMIEKMKNNDIKWINIKESNYEKERQRTFRELLSKFPNANMDMISLGMSMSGF
jgi:predicted MPP superfamily phosphohydrolase